MRRSGHGVPCSPFPPGPWQRLGIPAGRSQTSFEPNSWLPGPRSDAEIRSTESRERRPGRGSHTVVNRGCLGIVEGVCLCLGPSFPLSFITNFLLQFHLVYLLDLHFSSFLAIIFLGF